MSRIFGARAQEYIKAVRFNTYLDSDQVDELLPPTVQNFNGIRAGLDVVIHGSFSSTLLAKTVEAGTNQRVLRSTGHGAIKGDVLRFSSGVLIGMEIPILGVPDADNMILASTIPVTVNIGDQFFVQKWITPAYNQDGSLNVSSGPVLFVKNALSQQVIENTAVYASDVGLPVKDIGLGVVDQIDTTPLMLGSLVPDSASAPLLIVASLAAKILKLRTVDDIGEFLGLYRDAAGTNLACILPLGGGEIDCKFDIGEDVYIRNMKNAAISGSGVIAINFLG